MSTSKRLAAEFIGTFWLVSAVCGSAVLSAAFPPAANGPFLGIGFAGIALAVGLSVVTGAYAVGGISGAHFNPAVTIGLVVGRRFPVSDMIQYIVAQVIGGIAAAAIFYLIASGKPGFEAGNFASNGYGEHSPGGYSLLSCLVTEVVMTGMFIFIILGATHKRAPNGFAGIAIGLALTLIHLMSIPVTGTSVNPARSTATAIFADSWALGQLWLFWVAPIIGAVLGALVYNYGVDEEPVEAEAVPQRRRMP